MLVAPVQWELVKEDGCDAPLVRVRFVVWSTAAGGSPDPTKRSYSQSQHNTATVSQPPPTLHSPPPAILQAHAHFIGIDPAHRGAGLGAALYDRFFQAATARDVTVVHAVTSPTNTASVAFHKALGFNTLRVASSGGGGDEGAGAENTTCKTDMGGDGVAPENDLAHRLQAESAPSLDREFVHADYDGPDGGDRVLLEKRL